MALARQRPELFGSRVQGVFLLATSAGGLVEAGPVGLAVRVARRLHLLRLFLLLLALWSPLLERLRSGAPAPGALVPALPVRPRRRRPGAGDARAGPAGETPLTVSAAFYRTLLDHDEHASLAAMADLPVTLLVGDSDRLTPASHSRRMAEALPDAELVVVPGAGHSVNITRQEVVDGALLRLLDRVPAAGGVKSAAPGRRRVRGADWTAGTATARSHRTRAGDTVDDTLTRRTTQAAVDAALARVEDRVAADPELVFGDVVEQVALEQPRPRRGRRSCAWSRWTSCPTPSASACSRHENADVIAANAAITAERDAVEAKAKPAR